jgi:hypothetical protein
MMRMPTGPDETGKVMEDVELEAAERDAEIALARELAEREVLGQDAAQAVAEAVTAGPELVARTRIRGRHSSRFILIKADGYGEIGRLTNEFYANNE